MKTPLAVTTKDDIFHNSSFCVPLCLFAWKSTAMEWFRIVWDDKWQKVCPVANLKSRAMTVSWTLQAATAGLCPPAPGLIKERKHSRWLAFTFNLTPFFTRITVMVSSNCWKVVLDGLSEQCLKTVSECERALSEAVGWGWWAVLEAGGITQLRDMWSGQAVVGGC